MRLVRERQLTFATIGVVVAIIRFNVVLLTAIAAAN